MKTTKKFTINGLPLIALFTISISLSSCGTNFSPKKTSNEFANDSLMMDVETETDNDIDSVLWNISIKTDEMTDSENIWASITSDNFVSQDFPYQGETYAYITVRYMKKYGYDVLISIDQGQIVGSDYNGNNYITARFDDGVAKKYYFNEASDGSSETVFLRNAKDFMEKCKTATMIKIDLPLYQGGRPVYKFHVDKPLVWPK